MIVDFQSFRFDMGAGGVERRIFMHELSEWLRESVGDGFFSITHPEAVEKNKTDPTAKWIIVCYDDHLKVLLREGQDATAFALRWS